MQTFIATINDEVIAIKQSTFPAGERYLRVEEASIPLVQDSRAEIVVESLSASSDAIMDLILFSNAIKELNQKAFLVLKFNYLPYGRQDRVCAQGESDSLRVFLDIISIYYDVITILDIHNATFDVSKYHDKIRLLDVNYKDFKSIDGHGFDLASYDAKSACLVIVDKGATQRVHKAAKELGYDKFIAFNKIRQAGKIVYDTRVEVGFENREAIKTVLVIDDICDGGRTFIEVAKEIDKIFIHPTQKILCVTHGIFSNGLENLKTLYHDIFIHNNRYNQQRLNIE